MARGLFAGRGAVGSKFRKMKEEKGRTAKLRPELAPTSPERKLVKSPIEKMVPEGSAKMVAVRPAITQIAGDVRVPTQRKDIIGGDVAPPEMRAQGAVAVAKDIPVSREVARSAAMDEIRSEVQGARAPIVGEAAVTAPQRVATTRAPAQTQAPGQVLGDTTQRQGITRREALSRRGRMNKYEQMYGEGKPEKGKGYLRQTVDYLKRAGEDIFPRKKAKPTRTGGRYIVEAPEAQEKSKRWWGGRFA